MKKRVVGCGLLVAGFGMLVAAAQAAVTQRWEVETSRVQPVVFEAVRGETLSLEASFKSYGRPVEMPLNGCSILWQTNGMGSAWWRAPAEVVERTDDVGQRTETNYAVRATFTPSMDPGADTVTGFLGATGQNYRAAFRIRFRHGPGAVPNTLAGPVPILDLAHTTVVNPPWPTEADFAATTTAMKAELKGYVDGQIVGAGLVTPQFVTNAASAATSNIVTKAYVKALGISTTNDVNAIIASSNLCTVAAAEAMRDTRLPVSWKDDATSYFAGWVNSAGSADHANSAYTCETAGYATTANGLTSSGYQLRYGSSGWEANMLSPSTFETLATRDWAASAATVNQMGQSLAAVSAHLNAEDARFVSTNYDSAVNIPEAYVEIKINNNWQTIWREMTRWTKFVGNAFNWNTWQGFHAWSTNVTAQLATKAERCWGIYDSETGEISPDGYTQISSSNILIAANMSYKRVVDTANAIWVLESNSGLATLGGTNGYFRVKDGDGNTQFEIIKGNLRELGCDAGGITVNNSGATPVLTIPYSVVADSHPTLKICTDLTTADWKAESEASCAATVSWSGSSGAYVATVTAKSNSSAMFVKATYMGGSETIINNIAPTKLQYIYIGNQKYAVGYATISGTGVMTLTPQ